MPTTQIEKADGFETLVASEVIHHSAGRRRYRVLNLDDSAPSDVIDARGFSMAWLLVDTIHTAPGSSTDVVVEAMSEKVGGQANTVDVIQGPAPLIFNQRPNVTGNIRTAGWFWNPPPFFRIRHADASGDFDVYVELLRTSIER